MAISFDPVREAEELREQLASDKRRLLFFFGAGTSQAVGLDGIVQLTKNLKADLSANDLKEYDRILLQVGGDAHVEHVLNRIRICRELLGADDKATVDGLTMKSAQSLDRAICRAIYGRICVDPPKGFETHSQFAAWINSVQRLHPVEIFSTNYDLLIERGLEIAEVPYFDGFVGGVQPYFSDALCESDEARNAGIPKSWVRLWKLHGSIGWKYSIEVITGSRKVVRTPLVKPTDNDDLMIFPSREKYDDSRRLPFIALHDRLRRQTATGECLLLIAGYSFGDEHINEVIFGNLRANNRLAVTVLLFDRLDNADIQKRLVKPTQGLRNLTVYSPTMALVGGVVGNWSTPSSPPDGITTWPFWDKTKSEFTLGNFANVPQFLQEFIGARPIPASKLGAS
jgi:hypothetical protein